MLLQPGQWQGFSCEQAGQPAARAQAGEPPPLSATAAWAAAEFVLPARAGQAATMRPALPFVPSTMEGWGGWPRRGTGLSWGRRHATPLVAMGLDGKLLEGN